MRLISYKSAVPYHTLRWLAGFEKTSDKLRHIWALAGRTGLSQEGRTNKEGKIVGSIGPFRSGISSLPFLPLVTANPQVFECQEAIVMQFAQSPKMSLRSPCQCDCRGRRSSLAPTYRQPLGSITNHVLGSPSHGLLKKKPNQTTAVSF